MNIVSVNLEGMSLIVLKKKCSSRNIMLKPKICKQTKDIVGTLWYESSGGHSLEVEILKRGSNKFHVNSDIARTMYKYYYKDEDTFPSLIHVQTIL